MTLPPLALTMPKPEWLTQIENVLEVLNEGVIIASNIEFYLRTRGLWK
jgi:hypothetical protein